MWPAPGWLQPPFSHEVDAAAKSLQIPVKAEACHARAARGSVCVAAIFLYTSLVYQLFRNMVQQLAVTTVNGGMIGTDEPKQHSSTSPGCAADRGPGKSRYPPCCPGKDSDRYAPVILTMKIRYLNSCQMISVPNSV